MRTVFADTGYWIALLNPTDDLHQKARSLTTTLMPVRIVTSEMIFSELLNAFSKQGRLFRQAAVALINQSCSDPRIEVVPQTSELFKNALELYQQRPDQQWSHTDCASFLIMQEQQILQALAHDKHFEQAGFITLLRQNS